MKTLFDRPIAHTNDPQTSYDAGEKAIKSGLIESEMDRIRSAIEKHFSISDFTGKELAEKSGINYFIVYKRLSVLRSKGEIKLTGVERDGCTTYLKAE